MSAEPVTHLTRQIIRAINEEPGKKTKAVVQYISRSEQTLKEKVLYSVRLSDGTFVANFLLYPNINDQFLARVNALDILEVGVLKKDANSPFMLIYEFNILYGRVRESVGNPVEYRPGAENSQGSEQLPRYLLEAAPAPPAQPERSSSGRAAPRAAPPAPIDEENVPNNVLYTEIANLNMYDRSWSIRGRIVRKSEIRRFRTASREGCVFSVVIRDESRAIQASFFNEVAEKFHPRLVEGQVYCFSDGDIRNASRFNSTDNKYEVAFNERSVIREIPNDPNISSFSFNLCTIEEAQHKSETDVFDVLGIVEDPGAVRQIILKDGTSREKRGVSIVDQSGYKIEVSLWGEQSAGFQSEREAIVLFQDVRVKEYNGKTLTTSMSSRVLTKVPDCPQLKALILFRNSRQRNEVAPIALSEGAVARSTQVYKLAQLAQETEALLEDPDNGRMYFTAVGYSLRVVNNLYYDSCPTEGCLKKLSANPDSSFYCEKCHKTFDKACPRLMTTLKFSDDSGSIMAMVTGEEHSQLLFGCSTERLKEMKEENENALNDHVKDCLFGEYRARISAKKDVYNGEAKVRYQLHKLVPLSQVRENINDAFYQFLTA